jgi:CSLREA domain-containing protein
MKSYAVVVAIAGSLLVAGTADARTFRVTKTGDPAPGACTPGDCSLREAVLAANNNSAGADRIVLPNRRRAYKLQIANSLPTGEDGNLEGDLDVTNDPLTIQHKRRGVATIDGNGLDRVLQTFERLTLKKIRVKGGDGLASNDSDGGGINAQANLVLVRSRVTGNQGDDGGGIQLTGAGNLTLNRAVVAGNRSDDDGGGMRLSVEGATVTIVRSRIVRNRANGNPSALGGGIDVSDSDVDFTLSRSTLDRNAALASGGGLNADNPGSFTIKGSTFSGNSSADEGGALLLDGSTARIVNSTFSGNHTAAGGGAIFANLADVSLNGVTVVRNRANTDSVPFSETGGGLANSSSAFSVRNSLIALNRLGPGVGNDCTGDPFSSGGGNLLSTLGPSAVCVGFDAPRDKVRSNPKLGPLAKNGGPTKTVALKRGSAAIGNARGSAPDRDQRGRRRDSNPDSGAFERGA